MARVINVWENRLLTDGPPRSLIDFEQLNSLIAWSPCELHHRRMSPWMLVNLYCGDILVYRAIMILEEWDKVKMRLESPVLWKKEGF